MIKKFQKQNIKSLEECRDIISALCFSFGIKENDKIEDL